jgi:DNA modification methylase
MLQTNTIHHLDFFQAYSNDWLKFKLKRIDLIIADPPYGIRAKYGRNNKTIQNDEDLDTYYNFLSAANDILGNIGTLVTFCSEKKLTDVMSFISLNTSFVYRHCAIYKTNIGLGGRIRNEYDFILIYTKDHELMPQKDFRLFQLEKFVNTKDKQHPHKKRL